MHDDTKGDMGDALTPPSPSGSKRFHELLTELGQLHDKKPDYGMIMAEWQRILTVRGIVKAATSAYLSLSSGLKTGSPGVGIIAVNAVTASTFVRGLGTILNAGNRLSKHTTNATKLVLGVMGLTVSNTTTCLRHREVSVLSVSRRK